MVNYLSESLEQLDKDLTSELAQEKLAQAAVITHVVLDLKSAAKEADDKSAQLSTVRKELIAVRAFIDNAVTVIDTQMAAADAAFKILTK